MKNLVLKDNFVFLYLNKEFYTENSLSVAFRTYKDFFEASFKEMGKYFVVKIEKKNEDYTLKELADEFSNYLLSLEMSKK